MKDLRKRCTSEVGLLFLYPAFSKKNCRYYHKMNLASLSLGGAKLLNVKQSTPQTRENLWPNLFSSKPLGGFLAISEVSSGIIWSQMSPSAGYMELVLAKGCGEGIRGRKPTQTPHLAGGEGTDWSILGGFIVCIPPMPCALDRQIRITDTKPRSVVPWTVWVTMQARDIHSQPQVSQSKTQRPTLVFNQPGTQDRWGLRWVSPGGSR